jgi:hypothetical protein
MESVCSSEDVEKLHVLSGKAGAYSQPNCHAINNEVITVQMKEAGGLIAEIAEMAELTASTTPRRSPTKGNGTSAKSARAHPQSA